MKIAYVAAAVAGGAVAIAYLLLQSSPIPLSVLSNMSSPAFSLIPLTLAFYASMREGFPFAKSARWLAFGFFFWSLGEATWSFYALFLGVEIPFPSIADVFWLAGYPLVLAGMVGFLRHFRFAITGKSLMIAVGVATAATGLIAVFLIIPVISISSDFVSNVVGFAYPIMDIALLYVPIVGVLLFRGGRLAHGWYWLAAGAVLYSFADILFSYLTATGAYYDGHPLELLYFYGDICSGLGLCIPLKAFQR
jgi:hypothetical protein